MSNAFTSFFGQIFSRPNGNAYLPDIFPIPITNDIFIETDVETIYAKILTDVVDHTEGIPETADNALWDNCLQSEAPAGLITLLAKAMTCKQDLFLVYKQSVLRVATSEEMLLIKKDYKATGKSSTGVFISFAGYKRTDMVKLYSALEYGVVSSLYKNVNLAKAVQYKINDLRSSVGLTDSDKATEQAQAIAGALSMGKDVMLDAKDEISSHKPDLDATKQAIEFLDSKRCFYLGLPKSYVNGEQPGGLGDSGVGDAKAIERGLKNYFNSIIEPVMSAVFGASVTFKDTDTAQVTAAMEAIKTFSLVDDTLVNAATKKKIVNSLLGIENENEAG